MFGSHLSIAGTMLSALHEAQSLGFDTVQVFTKNQQQWKAKPLDPVMVADWRAQVARLGWDKGCRDASGGLTRGRVVSHASYLINLASIKPDLWAQSVDLMTDEIERCEQLGIPFLVHHPGSFVGADLDTGLANIARAYAELFKRTRGYKTVACLEGTAGSGSTIGGPFEHLSQLREMIVAATGEPDRIGFCLDTCHLHAAGHDMRTRDSARAVLARFDALCGLTNLHALHVNDSKGVLGSKLDRHMHLGEGEIGGPAAAKRLAQSGFAEFMAHPAIARIPKLLETPKGLQGKVPFDTMNLNRLRVLSSLPEVPAPKDPGPTSLSAAKERAKPAKAPAKKAPAKPRPASAKPRAKAKSAHSKPSNARKPGRSTPSKRDSR